MTGQEVATVLGAKRVARGKWRGKCPAHMGDNRTSLAIWEGKTAVMVYCHAYQCEPRAIMATAGLKRSDLFYSQSSDPKAIREAMKVRAALERKERAHHKRCIYLADMVRTSELRILSLDMGSPEWHKALEAARAWCEHFNTATGHKDRTEIHC